MFKKLEFLIAWRYLRSKRKEGFISITAVFSFVGIMIGVATLIIVMSVMNGFRHDLVERILGINAHLTVYASGDAISDYDQIVAKIKEKPAITYVNPIIEAQAMISSKSKSAGGLIKGLRFQDLQNKKLISNNITAGDFNAIEDKNSVLVGAQLAHNLGLKVGGGVKIISAKTNDSIIGSIPRVKTYVVGGIFESGMYEYDATTIFMNFTMAQTHFGLKDKASAVEVFANDPSDLYETKAQVFEIMQDYRNLFYIDWQQSNASFIEALKIESVVMFLILTLIILVAAFNIISSMIMLVKDKNKNIALLRTLGMEKAGIMRIFLICGSSIGFVGTFLGLLIGVLFSANIDSIKAFVEGISGVTLFNPAVYFLSNLPSKIMLSDVLMITIMSLAISFLATIYPAYKASKANPAEILRYE
jgi:lipoprotein-releasing system permease protein